MPKSKHRKASNRRTRHSGAGQGRQHATATQPRNPGAESDLGPVTGQGPEQSLPSTPPEAGPAEDHATFTETIVDNPEIIELGDHNPAQAKDPKCQGMSENVSDFHTPDLTPRQLAALPIILATSTNTQAARNAGIAERTLYRWLDEPDFRAELLRLREEAASLARSDLQGAMSIALASLVECAQSDNDFVRFCASRYIYNTGLQIGDFHQLQRQFQSLRESVRDAPE